MDKEKHNHICAKCGKNIKFWNINYYDEKTNYCICNQCANIKENIENKGKKKSDF
jgi:hypothetical protein